MGEDKYKSNLGWCEDGQTYCSISEKAYKENQFLKQWKDDVVESLAKYDANSVEEVYRYGIARGRVIERENIFEWLKSKDIRLKDVYLSELKEQKNDNVHAD